MKNLKIEVIFLFFIMLFAVFKTNCQTIALGLLPLLIFFYKDINYSKTQISIKKIGIFLFVIGTVFFINFLVVYNFSNNTVNLPHPDFNFYLKIAKNFNEYGFENNFTARNIFFNELNFATPYRFFDTWVLAFLLNVFPFSDIQILRLIYIPIIFLLVVFSVYKNTSVNSIYIRTTLAVIFLFLFGDYLSSNLIFGSNNGEVSVVSYPKLAIFFCVFIYFLKSQLYSKVSPSSILYLAFLPILIQTAFPIYIFIAVYILFNFKVYRQNLKVVIIILISALYFGLFYYFNSLESKNYFTISQFQTVKSPMEYFHRIVSITYNLIFKKSLLFFSVIFVLLLLSKNHRRIIYLKVILISLVILFSGVLVYAFLPSSPNSYQFLSNYTYPLLISLVYLISIDVIQHFETKSKTILGYSLLIVFGILGLVNQVNEYGFFNTKDKFSSKYDDEFVLKTKQIFNSIQNPIGLTYWSNQNSDRNETEFFDQFGTGFLINFSAKYDLLCLSALNMKEETFAEKVSNHSSAIAIFKRLNKKVSNKNLEQSFYNHYNFEYLFSDIKLINLPGFIKKDVETIIFDKKNKVYFYKLKRN